MNDPFNVALRLALYLDLMLLFGIAVFGLYSLRGTERDSGAILNFRTLLTCGSIAGVVLSLGYMMGLAMTMSGASEMGELHHHIFQMVLMGTEVGLTWMIRIGALVLAGAAMLLPGPRPSTRLWAVTFFSATALATLAWTGHGAMDEGSRRFWHFSADILHIWSAAAWLGALGAFGLMLRLKALKDKHLVSVLDRSLTGFESAGAVIVFVISATGIVNYLFIVGPTLEGLWTTTYGILLSAKLALFAAMMVLAALNRFHLSPLLKRSLLAGEYSVAIRALRRSMVVEFSAAVLILCLVAWLGTLSPEMEMASE